MGEAPLPTEHMLIIVNLGMSDSFLESVRQKFADIELTIYPTTRGVKVPPKLFRKATILIIFINIPEPKDTENLKLIYTFSAGLDYLMDNPILKSGLIPFTTSSVTRVSQAIGMTVYAYTASPRPTPESRHDNKAFLRY
ncbi:Dehydrogenase [Penicillium lividum]|nr:Dehydrogenase [Penicillium lividum]